MSEYYRPLAILGSLVGFENESASLCGAINTISWRYVTVELSENGNFLFYKPGGRRSGPTDDMADVALSDIFAEDDILNSLMANERISKDIQRLIAQGKIERQPENLAALRTIFERFEYEFLDGRFYLGSNTLESFAIHHIDNGERVSVWISLLPNSHAAQAVQEHLEILLPIPEKIRESLRLANSREEGFLMKDAEKAVGTSYAKFECGGKAK